VRLKDRELRALAESLQEAKSLFRIRVDERGDGDSGKKRKAVSPPGGSGGGAMTAAMTQPVHALASPTPERPPTKKVAVFFWC
jgi:hypothetical protein